MPRNIFTNANIAADETHASGQLLVHNFEHADEDSPMSISRTGVRDPLP